jgi:hypothetical protein
VRIVRAIVLGRGALATVTARITPSLDSSLSQLPFLEASFGKGLPAMGS